MADETPPADAGAEAGAAASETPHTKTRLSREDATCSVEGCKRPYRAKTYCNVHYRAWRHGEMAGHKTRYKTCTKEGCRKPRAQGSLCAEHVKAGAGAGEGASP